MKKLVENIFSILNRQEQAKLILFALGDFFISLLDIVFLAVLLLLVQHYMSEISQTNFISRYLGTNSALTIGLFFILFVAKNLLAIRIQQSQFRFVYNVASRISSQQLLGYFEGTYPDYAEKDSSVHIHRISQQPVEFAHYVLSGFQQLVTQVMLVTLTLSAILLYSGKLFLLLFLLLTPPVILIAWLVRKKLKIARTEAKKSGEKNIQHLKEALGAFVESNMDSKHEFFTQRYSTYQEQLNHRLSEIQSAQTLPSRLIEIFAVTGFLLLVVVNSWIGKGNAVGILTLGAFMAAAYKILPGIVKILNLSSQIKTYSFTLSELAPTHKKITKELFSQTTEKIVTLEFNNVSFSRGNKRILNNLNFNIHAGECVGLSGISGKGKTTALNILLGFAQEDSGTILINQKHADADMRRQYRSKIAYIKQEPLLIHDSILRNIVLEENGHYDQERLSEALRISGTDRIINGSADKLKKLITENGKNISGGQRQRIAFARAWYKNADLIIMDEPFNELDKEAENEILSTIRSFLKEGKMILLVTHNSESFAYCDKIVSLDES